MDIVRTRWAANRQFVAWDSKNHGIVMDTPAEGSGEGTGWRPVELLLAGMAGCTAVDVISILEKKREDVRALEIEVKGDPFIDEYPHYYQTIEVIYRVTGVSVRPESVARAIELSEEKYCSVRGSLGPQVNVITSYEVVEFEPQIGPKRT
jgi:putative redox protein